MTMKKTELEKRNGLKIANALQRAGQPAVPPARDRRLQQRHVAGNPLIEKLMRNLRNEETK
jgi:hypothetical protein